MIQPLADGLVGLQRLDPVLHRPERRDVRDHQRRLALDRQDLRPPARLEPRQELAGVPPGLGLRADLARGMHRRVLRGRRLLGTGSNPGDRSPLRQGAAGVSDDPGSSPRRPRSGPATAGPCSPRSPPTSTRGRPLARPGPRRPTASARGSTRPTPGPGLPNSISSGQFGRIPLPQRPPGGDPPGSPPKPPGRCLPETRREAMMARGTRSLPWHRQALHAVVGDRSQAGSHQRSPPRTAP
jgi:hypothetical protein